MLFHSQIIRRSNLGRAVWNPSILWEAIKHISPHEKKPKATVWENKFANCSPLSYRFCNLAFSYTLAVTNNEDKEQKAEVAVS